MQTKPMPRGGWGRRLCACCFSLLLAGGGLPVSAATLTVTSASDALAPGSGCTLRSAVEAIHQGADVHGCTADPAASGYSVNDRIIFDDKLAGETIRLTETITIEKKLVIQGPAGDGSVSAKRVTLRGGGEESFRLFDVVDPGSGTPALTVKNLRFFDALVKEGRGFDGAGAAIRNAGGALTILGCVFDNNAAKSHGGAIGTRGPVFVSNSTFDGNEAGDGGGAIWADTVVVNASTFSDNQTGLTGGGAIFANTVTASASTFSGNAASYGNGGAILAGSLTGRHLTAVNNAAFYGATFYLLNGNEGRADLANSLIVGEQNDAHCFSGAFTGRNNIVVKGYYGDPLIDDTSCGSGLLSINVLESEDVADFVERKPADHGGPTRTLALTENSPARGKAMGVDDLSTMLDLPALLEGSAVWADAVLDQRSYSRPVAAEGRDLGAYDSKAQKMSVVTTTLPNGVIGVNYSQPIEVAGGSSPYAYAFTGTLPPGLSMNAAGVLAGIPTKEGSYAFSVTVTDAFSAVASQNYSVQVTVKAGSAAAIPALAPLALVLLAGTLGSLVFMVQRRHWSR